MTPSEWSIIRHFRPTSEGIGCPDRISMAIMRPLDHYQDWLYQRFDKGAKVIIHCGYQDRSSGWHPQGVAIDCHVEGISLVDAYLNAERIDEFNGIGVYPDWNNEGLHLDARPLIYRDRPDARWGCRKNPEGNQRYVILNDEFLRYCLLTKEERELMN